MTASQRHWADNKVLNLDKDRGITSYGTVDQVKKLIRVRKVGHAGSLDPFATGVLLVCTGKATKVTRFLMELEKEYFGTIRLGEETETDDLSGKVLSFKKDFVVSWEEVENAARAFVGRISQHPPRISALKKKGRRLYEMARRGEDFETEAREVTIHDLKLRAFRFPELDFSVRCSKGTYVRALARDLGRKLGCGAHLTALRRTRVGPFVVENSVSLDRLKETVEAAEKPLGSGSVASLEDALAFLPACTIRAGDEQGILYGQSPTLDQFETLAPEVGAGQRVRILSSRGALLAVGKTPLAGAESIIRLEKVLVETHG